MGAIGDIVNSKPVESLINFFAEIGNKPLVSFKHLFY